MAAAAFRGTITFVGAGGARQVETVYFSDVNAAYVTWDNWGGATYCKITIPGPIYIQDISVLTGGTDCSRSQLEINNRDTGIKILHKGVITTVDNRVPIPIGKIAAGAEVRLKQLT